MPSHQEHLFLLMKVKMNIDQNLLLGTGKAFCLGLFALPSLIIFLLFLGPAIGLPVLIGDLNASNIVYEGYSVTKDDFYSIVMLERVVGGVTKLSWMLAIFAGGTYFIPKALKQSND
jgi:hypothetical protein